MKIYKSNINKVKPFVTKDSSIIRVITDTTNAPVKNVTLAEASLKPGLSTIGHKHIKTEEIYYFTAGSGIMTIADKTFKVEKGDSVLIPPGTYHKVKNTGRGALKIICACAPPYSHDDTINSGYNFKLMIFDFDGTLVESAPGILATANAMAEHYGMKKFTMEQVHSAVGTGLDDFIEDLFPDVLKKVSMDKMIKQYRNLYNLNYKKGLIMFKGVRETLKELKAKGVKLAIVSNKLSHYIKGINEELCIDSYFDIILGSESVRKRKPHPYPLNLLMKKFKIDKSETLMIGDSQFDIEAGKRAGCFTFFLTYGYADNSLVDKMKPDFKSKNFMDIIKLL
ncbi:MAG: HAD-IIIA family hydrolase [Candidatus Goldbacteria bacterium]|nr:HAD-IIIA family hydrolase [Candidatus Goldiibacteriota bacterium]